MKPGTCDEAPEWERGVCSTKKEGREASTARAKLRKLPRIVICWSFEITIVLAFFHAFKFEEIGETALVVSLGFAMIILSIQCPK